MFFPDKIIVDDIKSKFKPGTLVELDHMNDQYRNMEKGLKGTVKKVDDTGTIFVNWENGSTLGVVYGVDECHIINN